MFFKFLNIQDFLVRGSKHAIYLQSGNIVSLSNKSGLIVKISRCHGFEWHDITQTKANGRYSMIKLEDNQLRLSSVFGDKLFVCDPRINTVHIVPLSSRSNSGSRSVKIDLLNDATIACSCSLKNIFILIGNERIFVLFLDKFLRKTQTGENQMEGIAEEDDVMFKVQRPNTSMTSASLCDAIIFGQSLVIATKSAPTHVTYFACDVNELVTSRGNTPVAWKQKIVAVSKCKENIIGMRMYAVCVET